MEEVGKERQGVREVLGEIELDKWGKCFKMKERENIISIKCQFDPSSPRGVTCMYTCHLTCHVGQKVMLFNQYSR